MSMQLGTKTFQSYAQTLRRVWWADFIEGQIKVSRDAKFRASLVDDPFGKAAANLLPQVNVMRHRGIGSGGG